MSKRGKDYKRVSKILGDSVRDDELLIALESILDVYKKRKLAKGGLRIPLSLFSNRKLGVLEILVKCLKENFDYNYSNAAILLNRDQRTIWNAYQNARSKHQDRFSIREEKHTVPCNIFSDRKLGPLEALTIYVKDELDLSFNEISALLNRNYRTIWLSYNNGIKKRDINE